MNNFFGILQVLELESKLREYDSELLQLVSQQQEGQIESIRAHDLALYVKSLEEQAYAAQKKNIEIEKQVYFKRVKIV